MNRGCAIGCGVLLLLAAILIVVAAKSAPHVGSRIKGWIEQSFKESAERAALEASWQPPSPKPDESWFPARIGDWERASSQPIREVSAVSFSRAGHAAEYRSSTGTISMTVVPATELESEALFRRAIEKHEAAGGTKFRSQSGNRLYLRRDGQHHLQLWQLKDWLFLLESDGVDPRGFDEQFLRAATTDAAAQGPPAPAPR